MTFGAIDTPTRRCAETRAHYAHVWTQQSMYVNCPGGPDESATAPGTEASDALRAAADNVPRAPGDQVSVRDWLRARADSLDPRIVRDQGEGGGGS